MRHEVEISKKTDIIRIEDLEITDNIGFVLTTFLAAKCYMIYNGKGIMMLNNHNDGDIQMNGLIDGGKTHKTVQDALNSELYRIHSVHKFDTRKELYQWLAED